MATTTPAPGPARRTVPLIPVGHPNFKWTSGADVQATWRRFGWTAPSESRIPFIDPKERTQ